MSAIVIGVPLGFAPSTALAVFAAFATVALLLDDELPHAATAPLSTAARTALQPIFQHLLRVILSTPLPMSLTTGSTLTPPLAGAGHPASRSNVTSPM
jgi:hypothetical protein